MILLPLFIKYGNILLITRLLAFRKSSIDLLW